MDVHKKLVIASIAFTDFKNVTTYKKKRVATFNSDLKSLEKSLLTTITLKSAWNLPGNTEFLFLIFWKNYAMSLSPKICQSYQKTKKRYQRYRMNCWSLQIWRYSFQLYPMSEIRMLRKLFRYRQKLIVHRNNEKNRLQNSLTVSNIALASVVSDTFGKSSSALHEYPCLRYLWPKVCQNSPSKKTER